MDRVLRFRVFKSAQTSGGGDFIVRFDATVELVDDGSTSIEIRSLHENSDHSHIEAARDAILTGFQPVLKARGFGGKCVIENLLLHSVDFRPSKFVQCSFDALAAQFAERPTSSLPPK